MGKIIINNPARIAPFLKNYNGNFTLENTTINSVKTNRGKLTIRNSTINAPIYNYGELIIAEDVLFGEKFSYIEYEDGEIICSDPNKIAPYLSVYDGNFILENLTITSNKANYGNLTIINCSVTSSISNSGTLIFRNSTITNMISIGSEGTVVFEDDVIFGNDVVIQVQSGSTIIINDTRRISPYINLYYQDFIIENATITRERVNYANLTIRNSTFNSKLTNYGNIIIENNPALYMGNTENIGSITIRNAVIKQFGITNTGTLIIGDNVTVDGYFTIGSLGKVIADDINKYFRYIYEFTGETTIELGEYLKQMSNSGNLTIENSTLGLESSTFWSTNNANGKLVIKNSTLNTEWENYGVMELNNVTINKQISNYGVLIVSDDCIIGRKR